MRVLMLTSSYEPLTGGAETYARLLCEGLSAEGHAVVIATDGAWLRDRPSSAREPAGEVLRLRRFAERVDARDKVKWRQMQFSVLDELADALGGRTFDVVHANSHETLVLAAIVAMEQRAALVCSLHEQNPDLERFGTGRCLLSYRILPVDMYFAASRFYATRARTFGVPEDRLRLVYHGVPAPRSDPARRKAVREAAGVGPGGQLVVCPGRVYTRKAQLDLARALPRVVAGVPGVRVLLAGRVSDFGYERRMWALLDELGVRDRVTLRQDLTAADMPHVYAAADLVVQPSLEEGLGLAVIEAMAAGRPVIGTAVVGLEEVLTDGEDGLLVPPGRPDRLAEAMLRLLRDPGLAGRLAAGALCTVRERFSQAAMVSATLDGYRAAADRTADQTADRTADQTAVDRTRTDRVPGGGSAPWPPGAQVVLRHTCRGRTWCALPVTVLHDDASLTVIRIHAGSRWLAAVDASGRRVHGWRRAWRLAETEWNGHDGTYVIEPGRLHGVAVFTDPRSGTIREWYVNGQDRLDRTQWGFDTMDREADLVLRPGRRPRWKDLPRLACLVLTRTVTARTAWRMLRDMRAAALSLADPAVRDTLASWTHARWPVPDLRDVLARLPLPDLKEDR